MLAYAAGYFEADGSAGIYKTGGKTKRWLMMTVELTSTDREICDWFECHFGGKVSARRPQSRRHKQPFKWRATCDEAERFLHLIFPYMKLRRKREVADICLEFQRHNPGAAIIGQIARQAPDLLDAFSDYRFMLKGMVNELNARGRKGVGVRTGPRPVVTTWRD